jgi:two-component system, OmpR family, response regulator
MISSAVYCLIRWAPVFQLTMCPAGSSMKMAWSEVLSTSSRNRSSLSSCVKPGQTDAQHSSCACRWRRMPHSRAARPLRVIVVDDQPDVGDALTLLLEAHGHEVRTRYDGSAALAAAREQPPDVMFIDIGMPGITGYEVGRRHAPRCASRIRASVALTGYGREEDRTRALASGFDRHLTKPIADGMLGEVLASFQPD